MKKTNSSKGFTLIELLIVITIIGILAVALLPSILGAPARARDTARKADLNNIATALELYASDNQQYPGSGMMTPANFNTVAGTPPAIADLGKYISGGSVPKDPSARQGFTGAVAAANATPNTYEYCNLQTLKVSGVNYMLVASMEITGDGNTTAAVASCPAANGSVPTLTNGGAAVGNNYVVIK